MSCYFCGGSHIASIHSAPDRGGRNWSVGSMTLMRRYDGEPIVRVELDTSVMLDVSVNGSCGDLRWRPSSWSAGLCLGFWRVRGHEL